jgi:carotenoid cleavage dioxygenase
MSMAATMPAKLDPNDRATPWHLRGNNAPIEDEATITELEVRGSIPTELAGRFFRNGPNPVTGWSPHWFLGDGMIHGVELSGGKANWYRSRWVRTPLFDNPGADRMQLSMDPETMQVDRRVSTANTHVISHAGRILALEEGAFPYELSPELDTVGPYDYDGKLTTTMTAHPHVCGETGELVFFGYDMVPPYFTYYRAAPDGTIIQASEITMRGPTMIHDFGVGRNHTVVMDLPAVFDLDVAMKGGMPIRWDDDYGARMGVMARDGSDETIRWFDVEPCYVFHVLNVHDDGDEVVLRGCRMPELWRDNTDIGGNRPANEDDATRLHEWRFNLATGAVSEAYLDDEASEFPRLNDDESGLDTRYGYTVTNGLKDKAGAINKYDLADGAARTRHLFPAGHSPGEPVFVPAADGSGADEGYLMTFVHAADTDTSYLAILDAADVTAEPLAEVHLPRRVPTGFHGSWIPDQPAG